MASQLPPIFAPPDNPADFNTRIVDLNAPYSGDTGGFWCPIFVSNSTLEKNFDGEPFVGGFGFLLNNWLEFPGGWFFGNASMTGAWVNGDLTKDTFEGTRLKDGGYMQPRDQLIHHDKVFAKGTLARFYPPASELWDFYTLFNGPGNQNPDWVDDGQGTDPDIFGNERFPDIARHAPFDPHYIGTVGKPMLCIQRGTKLWMMTFTGRAQRPGLLFDELSVTSKYNWAMHYALSGAQTIGEGSAAIKGSHISERVLVGNIWEQEDADPLLTTEHYLNYEGDEQVSGGVPQPVIGKKFEAIYESIFIHTLRQQADFGGHPISGVLVADLTYPIVFGHLYGVGNDSLMFVDDTTYNTMTAFDTTNVGGASNRSAWHGSAWVETFIDVVEVVPYLSDRTGISTADNETDRSQPHVMTANINMADAFYAQGPVVVAGIPDVNDKPIQGGRDPWTPVELASHYPTLLARRDAPWCTGRTLDHGSICVGKWIWATDDPEGGQFLVNDGRIDPRESEGFAIVVQESDFLSPGDPPLEVWFEQRDIRESVISPKENLWDRSGIFQRTKTLEMRGYDRRTENECNGAIDCVLWTRGALIANDMFHHQSVLLALYTVQEDRFFSGDQSICAIFDDWHVTIQNPIVSETNNDVATQNLDGHELVMQQPDNAGIWIRRWKKGATPPYTPFDPTPGADNSSADWVIEHYDINEPGWFPIACCLTPYGDFCYVLISAYPADDWPVKRDPSKPLFSNPNGGLDDTALRTERFFRVIRPGHFDLKTRIPMPYLWEHLELVGVNEPSLKHTPPQIKHIDSFSGFDGDYGDNGIEVLNWTPKRSKCPVTMKCNEHWLYLNNFPASFIGQHPDTDVSGPDYDPDLPIRFSTSASDYDRMNVQNMPRIPMSGDPNTRTLLGEETLTYDWSIDLATGKIVVPWRQEMVSFTNETFPFLDPPDTEVPDINIAGAVGRTEWSGGMEVYTFRPHLCGMAYQFLPPPTGSGVGIGLLADEFVGQFQERFGRVESTSLQEFQSLMLNICPAFDCCQFVEGYTPPPVDY